MGRNIYFCDVYNSEESRRSEFWYFNRFFNKVNPNKIIPYELVNKAKREVFKQTEKFTYERYILLLAILFPLTSVPQLVQLWINNEAAGHSVITWAMHLILAISLLIYSIRIKSKPTTIMYFLWSLVYSLMVIGIMIVG